MTTTDSQSQVPFCKLQTYTYAIRKFRYPFVLFTHKCDCESHNKYLHLAPRSAILLSKSIITDQCMHDA